MKNAYSMGREKTLTRAKSANLRLAVTFLMLMTAPLQADDPKEYSSFAELRSHYTRAVFDQTRTYLQRTPPPDDAVDAYSFLFETALAQGWAVETRPLAETFLTDFPDTPDVLRSQARHVLMRGLALEGESALALELFQAELKKLRRDQPSRAIELAIDLSSAFQRRDAAEAAREVYEQVRRAFPFNASVGAMVDNRLSRLKLLGETVPRIELADLDGTAWSPNPATGKVLLIDFWATNCPPCLKELPELKRLHADLNKEGFEIFGISLDEDEQVVREFRESESIPWRLALVSKESMNAREAFHVELIPANFLIDAEGRIVGVDLHGTDLRREVERMLRE